jgi:hypothetical protein
MSNRWMRLSTPLERLSRKQAGERGAAKRCANARSGSASTSHCVIGVQIWL